MSQVFLQDNGEQLIIRITGRLDMETAEPVREKIMPQLAGRKEVIIDLAGLEYLSSYGLRMLLMAAKELNKTFALLKLAAVPEPILRVLKTSGLANFFAIHDTVEAAKASGARPASGDLDKVLK